VVQSYKEKPNQQIFFKKNKKTMVFDWENSFLNGVCDGMLFYPDSRGGTNRPL
jgi:hypothetical protein